MSACGGLLTALLLAVLAWRAPSIVATVLHDADLASPLAIAELAHHYDGAEIVTGRYGWWGPLWLLQLLRPLPGNTYFGSYAPILAPVLVSSLAALQARRLWGAAAAWSVLLISLSVGWLTWTQGLGGWSMRSPTWWVGGLAAILAVHLAGARRGIWRWMFAAACAIAVVMCGAILLSGDQLAAAGIVIPLAAAAVCALSARRWALGGALVVAALAVVGGGALIESYALSHGYQRTDYPITLFEFKQLATPVANTLLALNDLWRGGVTGNPTSAATTNLGALSAYVGFGIVVAALAGVGQRLLTRLSAIASPAGGPGAGASWLGRRFPSVPPGPDLQRSVWVAAWGAMLAGYLAAFIATSAQGALGAPVSRYLFGVPLAAACAFAPLLAGRRARLAAAAVFMLAALSIVGLASRPPWQPRPEVDASRSALFGRVADVARQERVSRGFAGYHTAYALTLSSGFALDVTPVGSCLHTDYMCAMYLHYIDKAYIERPNTRSFLLYDTSPIGKGFPPAFAPYVPTTSHPERIVDLGSGLQMAIYDYDFARDIIGGRPEPQARPASG